MTDFSFANHGSLCLLTARSRKAKRWVQDNVAITEQTQFWAGSIAIEPRYAAPILDGIIDAGLTVGG